MPVGMMIPNVPVNVNVDSEPASAIMNPRRLAAQAMPSTAPISMKRTRSTLEARGIVPTIAAGLTMPAVPVTPPCAVGSRLWSDSVCDVGVVALDWLMKRR